MQLSLVFVGLSTITSVAASTYPPVEDRPHHLGPSQLDPTVSPTDYFTPQEKIQYANLRPVYLNPNFVKLPPDFSRIRQEELYLTNSPKHRFESFVNIVPDEPDIQFIPISRQNKKSSRIRLPVARPNFQVQNPGDLRFNILDDQTLYGTEFTKINQNTARNERRFVNEVPINAATEFLQYPSELVAGDPRIYQTISPIAPEQYGQNDFNILTNKQHQEFDINNARPQWVNPQAQKGNHWYKVPQELIDLLLGNPTKFIVSNEPPIYQNVPEKPTLLPQSEISQSLLNSPQTLMPSHESVATVPSETVSQNHNSLHAPVIDSRETKTTADSTSEQQLLHSSVNTIPNLDDSHTSQMSKRLNTVTDSEDMPPNSTNTNPFGTLFTAYSFFNKPEVRQENNDIKNIPEKKTFENLVPNFIKLLDFEPESKNLPRLKEKMINNILPVLSLQNIPPAKPSTENQNDLIPASPTAITQSFSEQPKIPASISSPPQDNNLVSDETPVSETVPESSTLPSQSTISQSPQTLLPSLESVATVPSETDSQNHNSLHAPVIDSRETKTTADSTSEQQLLHSSVNTIPNPDDSLTSQISKRLNTVTDSEDMPPNSTNSDPFGTLFTAHPFFKKPEVRQEKNDMQNISEKTIFQNKVPNFINLLEFVSESKNLPRVIEQTFSEHPKFPALNPSPPLDNLKSNESPLNQNILESLTLPSKSISSINDSLTSKSSEEELLEIPTLPSQSQVSQLHNSNLALKSEMPTSSTSRVQSTISIRDPQASSENFVTPEAHEKLLTSLPISAPALPTDVLTLRPSAQQPTQLKNISGLNHNIINVLDNILRHSKAINAVNTKTENKDNIFVESNTTPGAIVAPNKSFSYSTTQSQSYQDNNTSASNIKEQNNIQELFKSLFKPLPLDSRSGNVQITHELPAISSKNVPLIPPSKKQIHNDDTISNNNVKSDVNSRKLGDTAQIIGKEGQLPKFMSVFSKILPQMLPQSNSLDLEVNSESKYDELVYPYENQNQDNPPNRYKNFPHEINWPQRGYRCGCYIPFKDIYDGWQPAPQPTYSENDLQSNPNSEIFHNLIEPYMSLFKKPQASGPSKNYFDNLLNSLIKTGLHNQNHGIGKYLTNSYTANNNGHRSRNDNILENLFKSGSKTHHVSSKPQWDLNSIIDDFISSNILNDFRQDESSHNNVRPSFGNIGNNRFSAEPENNIDTSFNNIDIGNILNSFVNDRDRIPSRKSISTGKSNPYYQSSGSSTSILGDFLETINKPNNNILNNFTPNTVSKLLSQFMQPNKKKPFEENTVNNILDSILRRPRNVNSQNVNPIELVGNLMTNARTILKAEQFLHSLGLL